MDQPVRFVARDDPAAFATVEAESCAFVEASYKAVDLALGSLSTADPKNLMFIKSFLGPIENFMSPQVRSRLEQWMPDRSAPSSSDR